MATYTGFLTSAGLPELAADGEVDFAAMTERRAVLVTLVDQSGQPVSPGSNITIDGSGVDSLQVTSPDGQNFHVRVDNGPDVLNLDGPHAGLVAIVDGSGNQITSFGGGTQYTEGDVDATITGTAAMWEDTGDTLRVASAAKPLPVTVISGGGANIASGALRIASAIASFTSLGGVR